MEILENHIIWARWGKYWYPCLVLKRSYGFLNSSVGPELPPPYFYGILLGDGCKIMMKANEENTADFCQGFSDWFHVTKPSKFITIRRAIKSIIQMIASEFHIELEDEKCIEWGLQNLHRFCNYVVSDAMYEALTNVVARIKFREQHSNKQPLIMWHNIMEDRPPENKLYDAPLNRVVDLPDPCHKVQTTYKICPVGWLCFYRSIKHKAFLPCVVISPNAFDESDHESDKIFISSFVAVDDCYPKYKVHRSDLLDLLQYFPYVYTPMNKDRHYRQAISKGLMMLAKDVKEIVRKDDDDESEYLLQIINWILMAGCYTTSHVLSRNVLNDIYTKGIEEVNILTQEGDESMEYENRVQSQVEYDIEMAHDYCVQPDLSHLKVSLEEQDGETIITNIGGTPTPPPIPSPIPSPIPQCSPPPMLTPPMSIAEAYAEVSLSISPPSLDSSDKIYSEPAFMF